MNEPHSPPIAFMVAMNIYSNGIGQKTGMSNDDLQRLAMFAMRAGAVFESVYNGSHNQAMPIPHARDMVPAGQQTGQQPQSLGRASAVPVAQPSARNPPASANCNDQGPDGLACTLMVGHNGAHLSIVNNQPQGSW